jgi:hypothetical protein
MSADQDDASVDMGALSVYRLHQRLHDAEIRIASLIGYIHHLHRALGHLGVPEPQFPAIGDNHEH